MSTQGWMRCLTAAGFVLLIACEPADNPSQGDGDGDGDGSSDGDGDGDGDGDDGGVCVDTDTYSAFYVGPCEPYQAPPEPTQEQLEEGDEVYCESHADCTEGLNGRCTWVGYFWGCIYDDCMDGEACPAGQLCACSPDGNQCVPANCETDEDCEGDATCRWNVPSCDSIGGRFCHTPQDSCCVNADCPDGEDSQPIAAGHCGWKAAEQRWSCGFQSCYD